MKNLIKVVIVEDNAFIRSGWEEILDTEKDLIITGSFDNSEDALVSKAITQCDIVLMDIGLPGMSGVEAVKILMQKQPEVKVIMISVYEDDQNIFDALCNGAVGYLHKKVSPDALLEAIRSTINGGSPMSPNIARKVIASFQQAKPASKEEELNDREMEVLKHMSLGKSYSTIAADIYLSVDGVRYHIRNIYRKLQVHSSSEAVAKGIKNRLIE